MKKKILIPSIAVLAAAAGLVANSTAALFTDKDEAKINVSSGKIDVSVTMSQDEVVFSSALSKDYVENHPGNYYVMHDEHDNELIQVDEFGYEYYFYIDPAHVNYSSCGGVATISDSTLNVTKMVAGDRIIAGITYANNSNVSAKMRTIVECVSTDPEDLDFFSRLEFRQMEGFNFDGATSFTNTLRYVSDWTVVEPESDPTELVLDIWLPMTETIQNENCSFKISVEAVQANAYTFYEGTYLYYYSGEHTVTETEGELDDFEVVCKEDLIFGAVNPSMGPILVGEDELQAGDTIKFRVRHTIGAPSSVYEELGETADGYGFDTFDVAVVSENGTPVYAPTERSMAINIDMSLLRGTSVAFILDPVTLDGVVYDNFDGEHATIWLSEGTTFTIVSEWL